MHGHEAPAIPDVGLAIPLAILIGLIAFTSGLLPIPIGYERGKVAWLMWCGTGMHAHVVYWTDDHGFQTLHPADRSGGVGR